MFLHFHYDKEQLVNGTRLHILTSDWKPGDDAMTALVTGQLVLGDDRCMRLAAPDGTQVDLVWPADYEATVQRIGQTDQLKVYDTERDIVARSSDHIELGGGSPGRPVRRPALRARGRHRGFPRAVQGDDHRRRLGLPGGSWQAMLLSPLIATSHVASLAVSWFGHGERMVVGPEPGIGRRAPRLGPW